MPAIELKTEEIGSYDPAAARARKTRLWSHPKTPGEVLFPVQKPAAIIPFSEERGAASARHYPVPVGPSRPGMEPRAPIQIRAIIRIVAHVYGLTVNDILSQRRMWELVRPRQEAMWLAKKYTLISLPQIGRSFAGRDHTTVLHAIRKIDKLIAEGKYTPRADAWISDWRAYLGERDALMPAITAPSPEAAAPPPPRVRPIPIRELPPFPSSMPKSAAPEISPGSMWTKEERERVTVLLAAGWPIDAIGAHLCRSENAVRKAIAIHRLAPVEG